MDRAALQRAVIRNAHEAALRLVIVTELHIVRVAIHESKTNAPLIIDCDRMMPRSVPLQRMQPISGRHAQVRKACRDVDEIQFAQRTAREIIGQVLRRPSAEELLGPAIGKGLDHPAM